MKADTVNLGLYTSKEKYKLNRTRGGMARVDMRSRMNSFQPFSLRVWVDREGWFHRVDGPAVENDNGVKIWFVHGERTKG